MKKVYLQPVRQFETSEQEAYQELKDYQDKVLHENLSHHLKLLKPTNHLLSELLFSTSTGVFNLHSCYPTVDTTMAEQVLWVNKMEWLGFFHATTR